MDAELLRLVEERLADSGSHDEPWALLVLAAAEGRESLDQVLGGGPAPKRRRTTKRRTTTEDEPLGAYLRSITVEGFRGVGPKRTLQLAPVPGLMLVTGRNGSGKSSFAEAVEILLTGHNWRWLERSVVWAEGWRNLHHPSPAHVAAELAVEGESGVTTVTRTWADGADLDESQVEVRLPSKGKKDLAALGWTSALEAYRPFLSYNELGSRFDDGPTRLHDRLSLILGLGDLEEALALLTEARLARERVSTQARKVLPTVLGRLQQTDDSRATRAAAALSGMKWDLAAAADALGTQTGDSGASEGVSALRALATLETPSLDDVLDAADALRSAADDLERRQDTEAAHAGDIVGLLRDALSFHDRHAETDCPVCGSKAKLTPAWRERATKRIDQLTEKASEWQAAHAAGRVAIQDVQELLGWRPAVLESAPDIAIDLDPRTRAASSAVRLPVRTWFRMYRRC